MDIAQKNKEEQVDALFQAGMHFGYARSKRHPSTSSYIFGTKNSVEIFDLEATSKKLEEAKAFIGAIASEGKQVLFVSGKSEAKEIVKLIADSINQPYVAGRFVGGTLTNFPQIRRRVEKLEKLTSEKEKGDLSKYTKKERLLIDREIERLKHDFGGIVSMKSIPAAIVLIDPKKETIAVDEAKRLHIPTVALANSDCNLKSVNLAVPGNDSLKKSITYFLEEIAKAYRTNKRETL